MSGYMPVAKTTEHSTPAKLFDAVDAEFGPFDCDPACLGTEHSAITILARGGRIYVPPRGLFDDEPEIARLLPDQVRENGLTLNWPDDATVWLNCPYGDDMPDWIAKAVLEASKRVRRVVALLPVRSDTKAFHEFVFGKAAAVCFILGRISFGRSAASAPFPSCLVVWDAGVRQQTALLTWEQGRPSGPWRPVAEDRDRAVVE